MKIKILLICVMLFASVFRLSNLSPYKFYPDSYQNLMVERNIKDYTGVIGRLGKKGMVYPDIFMWSRPVYPLLILLTNTVILDEAKAAQTVAVVLGITAILLAYLYIKNVFQSREVGIAASVLLALSFGHIVWGGFILTETTGIFLNLLFLWLFFHRVKESTDLADYQVIVTGLIFALAVFSRYEYILFALPASLYILIVNPKPYIYLINISTGAVFTAALILSRLYPLSGLGGIIINQLKYLAVIGLGAFVVFIVIAIIIRTIPAAMKNILLYRLNLSCTVLIISVAFLFFMQLLVKYFFRIQYVFLPGMTEFFSTELLIGIYFITGLIMMVRRKVQLALILYVLFSVIVAVIIYCRSNVNIARYGSHLIPFLLIPASYASSESLKTFRLKKQNFRITVFILILIISVQATISFRGLKYRDAGLWFTPGYEEESARKISSAVTDKKTILLVSFPEPYYYFSGLSTYSLSDKYPFIYLSNELNSDPLFIVSDMGMHDLFPNFSSFLSVKMGNYKLKQLNTGSIYRYADRKLPEKYPVEIYLMKVGDLKKILKQI